MPIPRRIPILDDPFCIPFVLLSIDFLFTIGGGPSFATVTIPAEIEQEVPLPAWLESWKDAEYVALGNNYGVPFGGDDANITMRAAAYLVSMTGGRWLSNNEDTVKELYGTLDVSDMFLKYLEQGE
ncbi:hypothetical protein Cantr_00941 [Candida viswanathii]|uniref:Uncharacterized protein n=1 Tax=Candida viswanathii TaxID=5486 RepID=A0A367YHC3_9ASCO|nr:hypothetical protein Cantr_00941 [Candida viswanathii]